MVTSVGFRSASTMLLLLAAIGGCSDVGTPPSPPASEGSQTLSSADVQNVVQRAAAAANVAMTIAVTDRGGVILAVYQKPGALATATGNFGVTVSSQELAVSLARTGAFFSNNQAPLSSRTTRFLSGVHFPPGVQNAPNAPLYGIENTNRGCPLNVTFLPGQAVAPSRSISGATTGLGIATGKADSNDSNPNAVNPGGVPLFKNGVLVGGIGVVTSSPDPNVAEFAAYSGATDAASGFGANPASPGVIFVDGIALPFVNQTSAPPGITAGVANGSFLLGPSASAGTVPNGNLIAVHGASVGTLTQQDVQTIVNNVLQTASTERAAIRLPLGSRAQFAIAVADLDGSLLALNRMPDTTVFSIDVAAAKARNMVYFSSNSVAALEMPGVPAGTAVTNRTIGFGAQPFFPPGIDGSGPGPFFALYQYDLANPCTNGHQPANLNQNGVVFFPGSVPLYKNGVLAGGLGISGDGVDQDDYAASGGSVGFEAPTQMRADQIQIQGIRLPYLKFPRNPTL